MVSDGGLWVFGYGSLMWDPGFNFEDVLRARLFGYHRALCVLSIRYRGTSDRPGIVLGLDRGGSCHGRAFRVAQPNVEATRTYLKERELVTGAYRPMTAAVRLEDGRRIKALTFVARRDHRQYVGSLPLAQTVEYIRQGCGPKGTAREYLANVVTQLDALGIHDGPLHAALKAATATKA